MTTDPKHDVIGLTADIVVAYVDANHVQAGDLPALIQSVYDALNGIGGVTAGAVTPDATSIKATPAQIRRSITPDALISFVDGRPYKMLKRHLATQGFTVQDYKTKFGLPSDYPMTAPSYSAARSAFAKSAGLGQRVRKVAATVPAKAPRKPRAKPADR